VALQVADKVLCSSHFEEDKTTIAENTDDCCYMVRKLQEAYERRGLTTNEEKYEYITLGKNEKDYLRLEDDYIREVHKCNYLGVPLTKTVTVTKK
jgi:hypothetical protein